MITTDEFDSLSRAVSKDVDPSAVLRQYQQYVRATKGNPDLDARSFIVQHLPAQTDILISDVVQNLVSPLITASSRIQSFVKHRKYGVSDSVRGWFIPKSAYKELSEFLYVAVPVKPLFESLCDVHCLPSDRMIYCEVTKLLGRAIKKESNHPCCLETEYLIASPEEAEDLVLSALCASLNTNSDRATLISIEAGASQLSVSPSRLQVWVAAQETEAWHRGSNLISKASVGRLCSDWEKVVLLDEHSVHNLFPDIPLPLIAPLLDCIPNSKPANEHLLLPHSFPQQESGIFAATREDAYSLVKTALGTEPFISVKQFADISGLKKANVISYMDTGVINSLDTPDGRKVTYSELEKHIRDLRDLVSMDDVVLQTMVPEDNGFRPKKFNHRTALLDFCNENHWWNLYHRSSDDCVVASPIFGKVLKDSEAPDFSKHIQLFLTTFGRKPSEKLALVLHSNEETFPTTAALLSEYFLPFVDAPACAWEMADMLFFALSKRHSEISDLSMEEIQFIVEDFKRECGVTCCKLLFDFVEKKVRSSTHIKYSRTGYKRDTSAYSLESFAIINYVCLDPEAWKAERLIDKAINNPVYANLWLFVSGHCVSGIRDNDYSRLPPPWLPDSPEETLAKIRAASENGQDLTDILNNARSVTVSFLAKIEDLSLTPHKTENVSNVSPLYFDIPRSCFDSFGIILSIAAAHYYLSAQSSSCAKAYEHSGTFISPSTDKNDCWMFFGPKFVKACDGIAFSGLRANKAFLQSREYEYSHQDGASPYVSYALASAMRSHKGGYGKLSETTAIYLRDSSFSGMTPEFVAKQMLERGTCSWVVDRVFATCFGQKYTALTITGKTQVIKDANIDAFELVAIKDLIQAEQDEVANEIADVLNSPDAARSFLDRFLSGDAIGKKTGSGCALHASGRTCIYNSRQNCYWCRFEIRSKVSFYHYLREYKRLDGLARSQGLTETEQKKNKYLAMKCLSIVSEMFTYMDKNANDTEMELYFRLYELSEGEMLDGIN